MPRPRPDGEHSEDVFVVVFVVDIRSEGSRNLQASD
jgi:hypothetical protein